MKIVLVFLLLINSVFAQKTEVKNKWPFYYFGPFFPPEKETLVDHKTAEKILCKHVPTNCKIDRRDSDFNREYKGPYRFVIKILKNSPSDDSPVSGLLVHYHSGLPSSEWDIDDISADTKAMDHSFVTDLKGNRVSLSNFQDHEQWPTTFYRVYSVVPEPSSNEEKEYWLRFSSKNPNTEFWMKHRTKVYDLKYSKLIYEFPDFYDKVAKKNKVDEAKTQMKKIFPGIENTIKGKVFSFNSFEDNSIHWTPLPFYITDFDGTFLHLKVSKLSRGQGDMFDLAKAKLKYVNSVGSKRFETLKSFEDPCDSYSLNFWKIKLEAGKFNPIELKIKPEDLFEGSRLKPFFKIYGASDPLSWDGHLLPWYVTYQKMVKDQYFMMEISEEKYIDLTNQARKMHDEHCIQKDKKMK